MSQPFIGEVRMVGFNFAPAGWALCQGQLLAISQNQTLFQILGTTYGGDGINTFGLPNLSGRVPVHPGGSLGTTLGQAGGLESVVLTTDQIPAHNHLMGSFNQATAAAPAANVFAGKPRRGMDVYAAPPANVAINSNDIVGGSLPHDNMQPYLVVNFVIALFGIFPSRN
jgi:microcystin-dependent protein